MNNHHFTTETPLNHHQITIETLKKHHFTIILPSCRYKSHINPHMNSDMVPHDIFIGPPMVSPWNQRTPRHLRRLRRAAASSSPGRRAVGSAHAALGATRHRAGSRLGRPRFGGSEVLRQRENSGGRFSMSRNYYCSW